MKKTKKTRAASAAQIASIVGIIAIAAMIGFGLSACGGDDGGDGKDITLEGSDELPLGATFDLSTAKFTIDGKEVEDVEITWTIKDAKGTGATLTGKTFNANEFGIGTNWGEVVLTAAAVDQDFTKDFSFWLKRWNPTTKTAYLTADKGPTWNVWETGDAIKINDVVNNFTLTAETEYTVSVSGTLTGELGDSDIEFYFLNTGAPDWNFIRFSYNGIATITEDLGGAGTATATVITNNQFTGTNRNNDRIGIQVCDKEISDSDVGKVMLKISNITVSITPAN